MRTKVHAAQTTVHFTQLAQQIVELRKDFVLFYEQNNIAAGQRLRRGLRKLSTVANTYKKEVLQREHFYRTEKSINEKSESKQGNSTE